MKYGSVRYSNQIRWLTNRGGVVDHFSVFWCECFGSGWCICLHSSSTIISCREGIVRPVTISCGCFLKHFECHVGVVGVILCKWLLQEYVRALIWLYLTEVEGAKTMTVCNFSNCFQFTLIAVVALGCCWCCGMNEYVPWCDPDGRVRGQVGRHWDRDRQISSHRVRLSFHWGPRSCNWTSPTYYGSIVIHISENGHGKVSSVFMLEECRRAEWRIPHQLSINLLYRPSQTRNSTTIN